MVYFNQIGCDHCGQNLVRELITNNFKDVLFASNDDGDIYNRFYNVLSVKNPYWWYTSIRRRMDKFHVKPIDTNYFKLWGYENSYYMDDFDWFIRCEDLLHPIQTLEKIGARFKLTRKNSYRWYLPIDLGIKYLNYDFAVYQEYMKFYDAESINHISYILKDFEVAMKHFQYGIARP